MIYDRLAVDVVTLGLSHTHKQGNMNHGTEIQSFGRWSYLDGLYSWTELQNDQIVGFDGI